MALALLHQLAGARIEDANFLVLARDHQLRAVPVEAAVKDQVGQIDAGDHAGGADVPEEHLEVGAGAEQHILGGRMPEQEAATSLVAGELEQRLGQVLGQTAVRNLPEADHQVLGGGRDDVVIERVEGDIQHRSFVSRD